MSLQQQTNPRSAPVNLGAQRILIVDDNPTKANSLGEVLTRRGYRVTVVNTAAAALLEVEKDPALFSIVDGDLGDFKFGSSGKSGKLVAQLQALKLPFGRVSSLASEIPADLHGLFCFSWANELCDWLKSNLPAEPKADRLKSL